MNSSLWKLAHYVARHRILMLSGILLLITGTVATLAEPWLFGYAIDHGIVPGDRAELARLAGFFGVIVFVRICSMIGQSYLFERLGQAVMQDLRLALVSQYQRLPISLYDKVSTGSLITRLTNDVAALAEMFSAGFAIVSVNLLIVVGTVSWLFWLNPKLAAISMITLPPLIFATYQFSKRLGKAYSQARERLSLLNAFFAESAIGIRVIQIFNRQDRHRRMYSRLNESHSEAQFSAVRVFALFHPAITLASGISLALVIVYGAGGAARGEIPIGTLVAFFSYVVAVFQPMREIADKWSIFLSGLTSAERIFSILNWRTELEEGEIQSPALMQQSIRGHIRFENVSFGYDPERLVLKNFSVDIPPGTVVGVVGHTGAGKTTIISLLLRLYDPTEGKIFLDGRDLRSYPRRELRSVFGMVQQDVFLFSGSIEENLTLWRPNGSDRLKEWSHLVPQSRDLILDERGGNLSAGERQVLAFGRAICADPKIWILDEATASVDSTLEASISVALKKASAGRTSILIAHRLATVRNADMILVLHQGELREKGKHEELMAAQGIYQRLYRYQSSMERTNQVSAH